MVNLDTGRRTFEILEKGDVNFMSIILKNHFQIKLIKTVEIILHGPYNTYFLIR